MHKPGEDSKKLHTTTHSHKPTHSHTLAISRYAMLLAPHPNAAHCKPYSNAAHFKPEEHSDMSKVKCVRASKALLARTLHSDASCKY